ncbi:MAG: transporter substrate-binding domain-containing protein [Desulfosarcina sp.]|nr:transporter substrate-binding domain-containing protein [Desulfosarcina sp.]MBC2744588.1 transporter substrate-binding domain-containing protein [Desulfosarcina sp.]MBC2767498.1 amino acid ABC transporter substrate-binding protein [Desulfosarcina sp.]
MKALSIIIIILLLSLAMPASGQDAVKWVFTNYPPANYQTENGRFEGFFHDIVTEVFDRGLGIHVDIAVYPWKRCQAMVKEGTTDIMVTIPTPERLEYALTHSRPIWTKRRILYTYRSHPKIHEIQQLNGLTAIKSGGYQVISYLGNGWTEKEVQGIGITVVYATTVDGMYRMLAAKRGDLIIEEKSLVAPRITEQGLSESIVETKGVGSESGFHILISKKSPYAALISQVDREVEAMRTHGKIDRIFTKYGVTGVK